MPTTLPLVILLGTTPPVGAMSGFEIAATMAEETIDAEKVAPVSMIKTVVLSSLGGILINFSMIFAFRDSIDQVLAGPTSFLPMNLLVFVFTKNSDVD